MTEQTEISRRLPEAIERFVLHWGDMGGQWGVNRSVGQIHALLYISARPLNAEEIAETLGLARSNISNSLKELLSWKLIRRVPVLGDRRDHFEAEGDIWVMVANIVEGRMEREITPVAKVLKECIQGTKDDDKVSDLAKARLQAMSDFVAMATNWYMQMSRIPRPKLLALIRLGSRIVNFIPGGKGKSAKAESD